MLGRKDYTPEELDHARTTVARQLTAYRDLAAAIDASKPDATVNAALVAFEPILFNNLILVLDRYFVHRVRNVSGKDGNPLNEVELLTESLMNNDGVLQGNNVIRFVPDASVLKLSPGDRIRLTADQFEGLADAFFTTLEAKFIP
jgi:hypothetical protein